MSISANTNLRLVDAYKREHGITLELHTFPAWRKLGRPVKKGQPAKYPIKQFTPKGYIILWFWDETQVEDG